MSRFELTVKSVDAATVAAIREIVPIVEQMPERYSTLFDTIARWMVAHKLPFGSAMTTYFAARPTLRSGKCATKNKATSCDRHQRSNSGGFRSSFWLREWPRHQLDFAEYALQEEYVGGDQTARPPTRSGQERVQVDQWLRGLAPSHARTHR
ncbi:MAG TPA: hypothetical protein VLC95_12740 [Anaerolineae bacterium]|nr:hypothetical protein [Anaerolineae bacterium]